MQVQKDYLDGRISNNVKAQNLVNKSSSSALNLDIKERLPSVRQPFINHSNAFDAVSAMNAKI